MTNETSCQSSVAGTGYAATTIQRGVISHQEETLAQEAPLQLLINDMPFIITMRSPGSDEALAAGFLFSEKIITAEGLRQAQWTRTETPDFDALSIKVPEIFVCDNLKPTRAVISYASCGICGSESLQALSGERLVLKRSFDMAKLPRMFQAFGRQQPHFQVTGGCHGAALFSLDGELLSVHEDVGRHNAVDKCIGDLIQRNALDQAEVLLVSGRISFEIVVKALHAACPVVAAISAPSTLAVDLARQYGMSVIGFCREERATIYSHPEQVMLQGIR